MKSYTNYSWPRPLPRLRRQRWRRVVVSWVGAVALLTLGATPGWGAEAIIITYGFFERTITLEDLSTFARGEGLSRQLAAYARVLNLREAELEQIRAMLNQRITFDSPTQEVNEAVVISQFLYTRQGEALLEVVGEVVQTPSRQSGFLAVRAALVLAAASEQGLTPLTFLEKFPAPAIRVDLSRGLAIAEVVSRTLNQASLAANWVYTEGLQTAETEPEEVVAQGQEALAATPTYGVERMELQVPQRRGMATLYLPTLGGTAPSLPQRVPLIVISHGLGDNRFSYRYLANYLTQRGFGVAVLDHPGSDGTQIESLLMGLSQTVVPDQEFVDRPQDVSALLDYIETYFSRSVLWRDRLDTNNVGVIGHSFGGYTALALAGAELQVEALPAACGPQVIYVNPSLLLQCQAESLVDLPELRDPRVQAVLVVNPVGSALFGPRGYGAIEIPTLFMAGVVDTVAPALPEQIRPFTWLQNRDRYLVLMGNVTHFSVIPESTDNSASIPIPLSILGPAPHLARGYLEVLSLGFFKVHLEGNQDYEALLTARYVQQLATVPLAPLSLVRELSPRALEAELAR